MTLPQHLHWWRKAAPGLHHLTLCGDRTIQAELLAWCQHHGWQIQEAHLGETWHLLAWEQGQLMLGFWSGRALPELDAALVVRAFSAAPQTLTERHGLLSGRDLARPSVGKIVCSCFSVGETAIVRAITDGCQSVQTLGQQLRCGSNCGSCIPELRALLKQTLTLKE